MFVELYEKLKDGEALNVFIKRNEDGTLTTSISFRNQTKSFAPVTATGTPDEMDTEFVDVVGQITEKIQATGLKVSSDALDKDLESEKPESSKSKAKAPAMEKAKGPKEIENEFVLKVITNAETAIEENTTALLDASFAEIETAIKADKKRAKALEAVRQNVMKAQAKKRMDEEDVDPLAAMNQTGTPATPVTPVTPDDDDDIDPLAGIEEAEVIEEEEKEEVPFGGAAKKEEEDEDITNLFD